MTEEKSRDGVRIGVPTELQGAVQPPEGVSKWPDPRLLSQPNRHGEAPHLVTRFGGEVVDVDYVAVETAVSAVILQIEHEATMEPGTLEQAVSLIVMALSHLETEISPRRKLLQVIPKAGFVGWLLAMTPTEAGKRVRGMISKRREAKRRSMELTTFRDGLLELRIKLATTVDGVIHQKFITDKHSEYTSLFEQKQVIETDISEAKRLISAMSSYAHRSDFRNPGRLPSADDEGTLDACYSFYKVKMGRSFERDGKLTRTVKLRELGRMISDFKTYIQDKSGILENISMRMAGLRREEKNRLYTKGD